MYYRGSQAAIVVYDLTNTTSFERAKDWVRELQQQGDPNIVVAFVGNKIDMEQNRKVTTHEAVQYAEDNHLFAMEVSAKTASGIQELFMKIGKTDDTYVMFMLKAKQLPQLQKEKEMKTLPTALNPNNNNTNEKEGGCAC